MCAWVGSAGRGVLVLELGILGPVQAVRDGRKLGLGGPKQRAVLALLLVRAGRVLPASIWLRCYGGVGRRWGRRERCARIFHGCARCWVPRLLLVAQGGGYAIRSSPVGWTPAGVSSWWRRAGTRLAGGRRGPRPAVWEALALWRGRALADVAAVEPLALEGARLEELRLAAVEGRAEAGIELGLAAEVTGELEAWWRSIRCGSACGGCWCSRCNRGERQADALAACRRARKMLADELGLEPGEELRLVEEAVLRHEVPPPVPRRVSHNLPMPLTRLLGRERELVALGELLATARLVTLTGACGALEDTAGPGARRRHAESVSRGWGVAG